jgi:uncharacterized circularly permuted ATP-grasp superfamily protein
MLETPPVRDPPYDEILAADGAPREHAEAPMAELGRLGPEAVLEAGRRRDAIFVQQGITY